MLHRDLNQDPSIKEFVVTMETRIPATWLNGDRPLFQWSACAPVHFSFVFFIAIQEHSLNRTKPTKL